MGDMTVGQLIETLGNLEDEIILVEEMAKLQSRVRQLETLSQRQELLIRTIKQERDDALQRYQELRQSVIEQGKQ